MYHEITTQLVKKKIKNIVKNIKLRILANPSNQS